MPRAPRFWDTDGPCARALAPLGRLTAWLTARRLARPGWQAPVPVICCGNATAGGAGKTTLALDLVARLTRLGHRPHALLRGHGGSARTTRLVSPDDPAALVGDEALLLATACPTWIGADRAASARAAAAAGASVLVMDDGLQNPTLRQDLALLVIDGASGFGNARLLPAGPLREPVATAAARCHAAVLIGPDRRGVLGLLPPSLPVLAARLVQDPAVTTLAGRRILAFAGIARPDKFFTPLADAGAILADRRPFPDHHPYRRREIEALLARAARLGAIPVTTPKDAVRLPPDLRARVTVIGVSLAWNDPAAPDRLLARLPLP